METVAIQGIKGSYHHAAALEYFTDDDKILPCRSFHETCKALANGSADKAVLAIENTIAGAILPNYNLIEKNNLFIIGEVYLPIRHHLMAFPGSKLGDINEISSHPMALLQCENFIEKHPKFTITEAPDTASIAQKIRRKNLTHVAAIASETAAKVYNLDIIVPDIQDIAKNFTRFVVLDREESKDTSKDNKLSMYFCLQHESGKLNEVLSIFSFLQFNLTKIQSVPIIEHPWEYRFYVDFIFQDIQNLEKVMHILPDLTSSFKILGKYEGKIRSVE